MKVRIPRTTLLQAFRYMCTAKHMSELYEAHKDVTAKYVHATSRGHEAIQIALGLQLLPQDFVSLYYRDDSVLLSMGIEPYELMLQLLAKADDPFSGGRTYYAHPSLRRPDMAKIPHQSSATGMQAIPSTGMAMGLKYKSTLGLTTGSPPGIAVCSLGDASCTEGEVSEAFHMANLKQLPVLYLIQDNDWDISAHSSEIRAQSVFESMRGFNGIHAEQVDGTDFIASYNMLKKCIELVREENRPVLLHAQVPLLNHHTSGVRKEWYRDDLEAAQKRDPFPKLYQQLLLSGVSAAELLEIENESRALVASDYQRALHAKDPEPEDLYTHEFAPTPVTDELGERAPEGKLPTVMVDSALFAIRELMTDHPECLLYGQDVGARLGGVFREAATLAQQFGSHRVFNTPIQEAFIVGSTVGMSAVGLKPIVEVQFADYIWPGLNQLFTEVSRSCYLSHGKWPVSMVLRVPIGAYGSGGPYHSSSIESVLCNIKGIKVVYPSTGADLKGLIKAAYYDPNPVIILEHKGLYWSKIKGTEAAKTIEPSANYIIPIGKGRIVLEAEYNFITSGKSILIISYGMGIYWALQAEQQFKGQIEILDLRSLYPLDETLIMERSKAHGKVLVVTEEPVNNSFAQSIAARISEQCFEFLDQAVQIIGAENLPAIPLNSRLEFEMLPNAEKVAQKLARMFQY
jgi:2-oxoisovalerate dehydrogenase E1 component